MWVHVLFKPPAKFKVLECCVAALTLLALSEDSARTKLAGIWGTLSKCFGQHQTALPAYVAHLREELD